MRIAIVAPSPRPFVFGGAERLWLDLTAALNRLTAHEVELIKVPSPEHDLQQVVESYRRFHELKVDDFDAVVVTKYPAWMVRHHYKVVYLQHKLRGLYDTYPDHLPLDWRPRLTSSEDRHLASLLAHAESIGTTSQPLGDGYATELLEALLDALQRWPAGDARRAFPGPVARASVHALDAWALAPQRVARYAAISHTVARRAGYFPPGVKVHVAHHPSGLMIPGHVGRIEHAGAGEPAGVRFLAVSRLDRAKRLDWVIRAFAKLEGNATLTVVGDGPQADELKALASGVPGVRVLGRLSDEDLARCYVEHDVAVFAPYEEDMGLVTLEAMGGGCPVITTRDSGGVCELVEDGVTGWVVEPDVGALSRAMQRASDLGPERLRKMGSAARQHASRIDWQGVVSALGLDSARAGQPPDAWETMPLPGQGRRVVVLAPFGLTEPRGGGANRIFHLYRELAELGWNVTVICLAEPAGSLQVSPRMRVVNVAAEAAWHEQAQCWRRDLGVPADDVAMLAYPDLLANYRQEVARWLPGAEVVVLSHPWALRLLPEAHPVPLVYDAHNAETDMKAAMWSMRGQAVAVERAVTLTRQAECDLVRHSALVLTVCQQDADALLRLAGLPADEARVALVPNGVEPWPPRLADQQLRTQLRARLLPAIPKLDESTAVALFVGARHAPNEEGLQKLASVWQENDHRIQVVIAGTVCSSPEVNSVARSLRWFLLGAINDIELRQWLVAADFGLNPMLSGGGTNLKVLQYAMTGAVVTSTTYGLRGLPPQHPRPWAAVGMVEQFQGWLHWLMDRPALCQQLRSEARAVALGFTWTACARRLADALTMIGSRA